MNMLLIVYFAILTLYGFTEVSLQKRFSKKKSTKPDAGLALIIIPYYGATYLSPVEYVLLKPALHTPLIITGFALLFIGIAIRIAGLLALKHNFSMAVECKDKSLLVTNGIYKRVRHPLYLATLLMTSSGCLIFSSIGCWAFFIVLIFGIGKRINKEEAFLNEEFREYAGYSKRSKKLIPFIY